LQGLLLKYDPKDIEFYYKLNNAIKELENDKKAAQDWLTKHTSKVVK
jgi:hypothetical protein